MFLFVLELIYLIYKTYSNPIFTKNILFTKNYNSLPEGYNEIPQNTEKTH